MLQLSTARGGHVRFPESDVAGCSKGPGRVAAQGNGERDSAPRLYRKAGWFWFERLRLGSGFHGANPEGAAVALSIGAGCLSGSQLREVLTLLPRPRREKQHR